MATVLILITDKAFHERHRIVKERLDAMDTGHDFRLVFPFPEHSETGTYIYEDFDPDAPVDIPALSQRIREEFDVEPAMVYKADLSLAYKRASERDFVARTYHALKKARELIEKDGAEYVFCGGGASLFSNAFFELAKKYPRVKAFRMYPCQHLNMNSASVRYFFCPNNYFRLPPRDQVDESSARFQGAKAKATRYVASVREGLVRPDRDARQIAASGIFSPTGMVGWVRTALRYVAMGSLNRFAGRKYVIEQERLKLWSYVRKKYFELTTSPPVPEEPYFLFILHHPYDSQLMFRGRHFVDQAATARILASSLPAGTRLYVKEHPVNPGMMSITDVRRMLSIAPNVTFVDYRTRFKDMLQGAKGVITINSTAGIEAMISGIPVVVLGEGFYREMESIYRVEYLWDLTELLKELLLRPKVPSLDEVIDVLARLIYHSEPLPEVEGQDASEYIVQGILGRILQKA